MRRSILLMLAVLASRGAFAQTAPAQPAAPLRVAGTAVELRVGFVGEGIARFELLPINAQGNVTEPVDAPHLVPQKWVGEPMHFRALPAQLESVTNGNFRLSFNPANWTIRLQVAGGGFSGGVSPLPEQTLTIDPATGKFSFPMTAPVYGLGEGGQPGDRRGSVNPGTAGGWDNTPFPLADYGEQLGIPWLASPAGWGVYFHQPAGTFDLTAKDGVFIPAAGGGRRGGAQAGIGAQGLDGFLTVSEKPAGLMKAWADITGYPSLPPIWSLGYIQSHRELESADQIMNVAKTFREKNMPCDMVIYLGTGFVPIGWNNGHGDFTFNKTIFPNPEAQLAQLHDMHFHVALHVTTRGTDSPRQLLGTIADPLEANNPNNVARYWSQHAPLMKEGVDAWWPDEGEGNSPASRLSRIEMYWDGPQQVFPDRRPFALHRTGAVGMQRYGGFLWSGDIKSNWATLGHHVPLALNISVGGTPYWGTDTGGFNQDAARELTGELFARWFQFSAFCPLFRSHGQTWQTRHLPWGFSIIAGNDRDPRIEEICHKFLDLRYQLMPYTYSTVYEGHEDGMPIMRALWLHYPQDAQAAARTDEYLWGRDLLVAPVVTKGETEHKVYLPPGKWHDYWTGEVLDGGKEISRKVDLATMPLYARAGAIIPFGPKENYTEEKPNDPLTIQIYPGADGQYTMIEDDGVTFSSKPMRLSFSWNDAARTLAVSLVPGSQMREPLTRHLTFKISGQDSTKTAEFSGTPLTVQF